MINLDKNIKIGIIGAGTMGAGIAQVASTAGHIVYLYDSNQEICQKAISKLASGLAKLVEKGKMQQNELDNIISRIEIIDNFDELAKCGLVIEAIIEDIKIKQDIFSKLDEITNPNCVLASNTSSLSIASISSVCKNPDRVVGLHFFNPANILKLVEIVPAIRTDKNVVSALIELMKKWGKMPVVAKDTPGFIVNKVARPFYGEALRIYEEGIANFSTIDYAMKTIGNFKMGPFELMDLIGNDVNYKVTETVFTAFYYDSRYKPSITQKRYAESGLLGRKSGRGFYDYSEDSSQNEPNTDEKLLNSIFERIIAMLINEAIDTYFQNIASIEDIDLAVTKGVNYPKGLFQWADEIGLEKVNSILNSLYNTYLEERYRPCPLIKKMIEKGEKVYR